jgi:hypothetical protein
LTTSALRAGGGRRKAFIVAALLIALLYVAAALVTDAEKLMEALRRLGWLGCMAVLGLSVVNYSLRFFRWKNFLLRLGRSLPLGLHFLYYLGGFAFTISPAKAGEALRSLYLRNHGVTYAESIAALFVERLIDLFAVVILASLIVLDHPAYRPLVFLSFLIVIIIIACVCQPALPALIDRFGATPRARVARHSHVLANKFR